jgi:hypothetical protein
MQWVFFFLVQDSTTDDQMILFFAATTRVVRICKLMQWVLLFSSAGFNNRWSNDSIFCSNNKDSFQLLLIDKPIFQLPVPGPKWRSWQTTNSAKILLRSHEETATMFSYWTPVYNSCLIQLRPNSGWWSCRPVWWWKLKLLLSTNCKLCLQIFGPNSQRLSICSVCVCVCVCVLGGFGFGFFGLLLGLFQFCDVDTLVIIHKRN